MDDNENFISTDQESLPQAYGNGTLKRMAEIRDHVDLQWINDYLKNNDTLLNKIIQILDEVDPEGIIYQTFYATGWNLTGEYAPEAKTILLRQSEWNSVVELEKIISEEFAWWFYSYNEDGTAYESPYYTVAARKIWNAWLELEGKPPEIFSDEIQLPERQPPIVIEV